MKTNEQLRRDVQSALTYEPVLRSAQIGVIANNGIVTLTGTVDNYQKKLSAEKVAKHVKGVRAVIEKIETISDDTIGTSDVEIAEAILQSFQWNWKIPNEKILIKVENGWVWLEGRVEHNYQRVAAKNAVGRIPGVIRITNNILLESEFLDNLEKGNVEQSLKHNWTLDAKNIHVKVKNNKVILTGSVDSLYERTQAARLAWRAKGVVDVENKLTVDFADDIY
ncbi:MAG: BON domain-containing protein [Flavobacterium sp.]|nr:MAG: BON domain-containing protein [Flavobacterium sp.]